MHDSSCIALGTFEVNLTDDVIDSNATYHCKVSGVPKVIDHILGSNDACVPHSYHTIQSWVPICEGVDHSPISCIVRWNGTNAYRYNKRRVLPYDRKKIGDPDCDKVFAQCVALCPSIPATVDCTSHCWILNQCFLNAAKLAY